MKAASESRTSGVWRRFVDWLQGPKPVVRSRDPLPTREPPELPAAPIAAREPTPLPDAPLPARIRSELVPDAPRDEARSPLRHPSANELAQDAMRAPEQQNTERAEAKEQSTPVALLEERVFALHEELRGERDAMQALQSELANERGRAAEIERAREEERSRTSRAEDERAKAREEMHAYRRVLAAAIANEKYAIDLARKSRQEAQARERALEEALRARGEAEGRAHELDRRVVELLAPRSHGSSTHARAAVILALALLLAGVGLAQWGEAVGALLARAQGAVDRPPAGLALALGTGAFAVAGILWGAWRREIRTIEGVARAKRTA